MKLENSKEALHKAQEASTSKKNDQKERAEKRVRREKLKVNNLKVYNDSQLVMNQVNKTYKAR